MAPKTLLTLTTAGALFAACSTTTLTVQRYLVSPDNNEALKAAGRSNISVGTFISPRDFDSRCRGMARIAPPKDETFPQYVQQALATELQATDGFGKNPSVVLSGVLEQLSFISTSPTGRWDISLRITSSNGKTALVAAHYEFERRAEWDHRVQADG
jgi:curli biogenesis system outer membrane secretion channel CsgG